MSNSFIENVNYLAKLDNAFGDSASFTKTNISFRGSSADVKFSMSYYDNTDMKIKSVDTLMQNALYSDLADILTQFKNSIELISGFTCLFTISNDNNAYLVSSISFSITSSDSEKKITKINFNMTKNGIEIYDTYGKINNPIKILPHLALYDDILKSSIININTFKDEVLNVNSNIISINTVSDSISHIITVSNNIDNVNSVARNIVPNLAEILQSNISASIATIQANLATTKANEASASELNASISESNASASEANVQAMKLAVEKIYDSFDDRFLGAFDFDPVIDNDGNPLLNGALYFNSSSNTLKVYSTGTIMWYNIPQIYLSSLLDVELTSISAGQILVWNGTKWTNSVITKAHIGLANVDNTSDANKPISTATQNALNTKVDTSTNQTIGGIKTFSSTIIGSISGNAATTTKLATARTISLTGDVAGNVSFDGSANVSITATIADDSHNHIISNVDGLQTVLDSKLGASANAVSATKLQTARTIAGVSFDGTADISIPFSGISSKPTTVSGYGLTDVYTKTESNASLNLKVNSSEKGVANGIATLDANGKVILTQIPDSVLGQLEYMGTWNLTTFPTATQKGQYWIASVSGNGYEVGDWAVWNGIAFDKVDNTDAVATVAGRTGNVVLTKSDVDLSLVDNTADATKNVLSATKWTTSRTIALVGDVAGSVSVDGSANVTITTTVQPNSVALGTDTTGNYVANITAGTGIAVTGTAGEGWSPTVALTNVGTAGTYRSVTTDAQGRIIAGTNPTTVAGYGLTDVYTKTESNASLNLKVNSSEKGVANGIATLDANGKVILTQIPDSVLGQLEYMGTWNLTTFPTATQKGQYWIASVSGNGYEVGDWAVWNGIAFDKVDNTDAVATVAGRTGNVVLTKSDVDLSLVDNTADATKNVLSATKWTTSRTIALVGDVAGSVSVDGSANVTITTTVQPNSVALGTDTTGNYVANITAGTGIAVTGTAGEGWSPTVALTNVGTAGTYRSVTTDAQGRIIAGTNPTTVAGYGLTDVYTKTESNALLDTKASLASPALTGTPTAPTANIGTNSTQIATTAYVVAEINKIEEW